MNEEIRDMIGRALHDEPAMGVDRDVVLAGGRRRLRLRRAGLAGGAVLGVLAVVAVGVGAANLRPTGDAGTTAAGLTSTEQAPVTGTAAETVSAAEGCVVPAMSGGFQTLPDGEATPEELAESARLTKAFADVALPSGVTAEPAVRLCAIEQSWGADFTVTSAVGQRSILLEVTPRGDQQPGECRTFGGAVDCRMTTLPDGTVVRITHAVPDEPGSPELDDVVAWRSDGTVVSVLETGSVAEPGSAAVPRVLDDDALIALATAPQLRTEWAGPVRPKPAEPSDRRATELSAILAAGAILPPGMQAVAVPDARAGALDFYVSQGAYKLNADLVDAAGEGNLFVNLGEGVTTPVTCDGLPDCTVTTLPDGSVATVQDTTEGGIRTVSLDTVRPSGIGLHLTSTNVSERTTIRAKNAPAPQPSRSQPPLDAAALGAIALLF